MGLPGAIKKTIQKIENFFMLQGLIHEINLIALGSLKKIIKWLNTYLLCVKLQFELEPFFAFYLFLVQKHFDISHLLLFKAFLFVFNNSCFLFLYIEKHYFYYFFYSFKY